MIPSGAGRLLTYIRRRLLLQYILLLSLFLLLYSLVFLFSLRTLEGMVEQEIYKQFDQKLGRAEAEMSRAIGEIIAISHNYVLDEALGEMLLGEGEFYETGNRIRKRINSQLEYNKWGPFIKVTIFDLKGRSFANWSRNFRPYDYLGTTPIAMKAKESGGQNIFSDFEDDFDLDSPPHRVINIHRKILSIPDETGEPPLLIMTISDELFVRIFRQSLEANRGGFLLQGGEGVGQAGYSQGFINPLEAASLAEDSVLSRSGQVDWEGSSYIYTSRSLNELPGDLGRMGWRLYLFLEYDNVVDRMKSLYVYIGAVNILSLILLLIFSYLINRDILKPIVALDRSMTEWKPDEPLRLPPLQRENEIGDIYGSFARMDDSIRTLLRDLKEEYRIREFYQMQALRSRLNPHFLFNTLNTVKMLAVIDKNRPIVSMIESLGELLNYSMNNALDWVPLADEIRILKSYIHIQNTRFGCSVPLNVSMNEELGGCFILKFILQPVVENIFTHGFDSTTIHAGIIEMDVKEEAGGLSLSIRDNGRGIAPEVLRQWQEGTIRKSSRSDSIGLPVIRDMIQTTCGGGYGVSLANGKLGGAELRFTLPLHREAPGGSHADGSHADGSHADGSHADGSHAGGNHAGGNHADGNHSGGN